MPHATMTQMSTEMRQCIQNCLDCARICQETITHCLQMGGKHAEPQHIQLLADCAEICQTSANFMSRGSTFHAQTCGVCSEVCERCGEDCEKMAGGDSLMEDCAKACRKCADSCRSMAQ